MKKIAIDLMGGDFAPAEILAGALSFAKDFKDVELYLVGIEDNFKNVSLPENCKKVTVEDYLPMDIKPTEALRRKKSTMYQSCKLVKENVVDAVVSAGNTGALLACATFVVGRMKNIERPTLAVPIPTKDGFCVLADAGANIDVKPSTLLQFGVMGVEYAKFLGIKNPKVGLLNVGTEENKGTQKEQEAFKLLKEHFKKNFMGNVEGNDINMGKVDVVVADGFHGNIAMKTMEGTAKLIVDVLKSNIKKNIISAIGALLMKSVFNRLKEKLDPRKYGGTFFVGVNGIVVKAHGNSDRIAIYHALKVAKDGIEASLTSNIEEAIRNVWNSRYGRD
ncbi:phosphate acyltransferase [Thermosipho melanesiensis]|uniref:Phosphate acyltransferase n=2 Tax=Thermosipho melanesiensis TaxID=46541 RepID=PLSX_THEM4|nr:phosphate acyltransferase PlsX [Thermosipho melanesiensis]A6LK88.1 RecName: Full=Phosphate acyltransferase; AltName: Full=Acyl-ACP phosphotransacylase; AltName: Full=Acyl-[acyl-carrier-protein]--phosphate acyltransferase; AltName: Full=Phosphate-acyl-ACP acyltransferase [Thermosipho melanesiensis BI429]ABR30339.1 fatty acid/phospholipid synthesis protein PlsX [Thermosipho melanesiensis BI429]APT73505.1 phosphate acyltransferase [Thermosipho melanesiensis]OOC37455.1 phosphate acyltransferase 